MAEPPTQVDRFDYLFEHFYPALFGLLHRILGDAMETEDTLQETYLKLADAPDITQRPDAEVGAWLRRVGMNAAFNRARGVRRARERLQVVGRMESVEPTTDGPAGLLLREEAQAAVRETLAQLPDRQRDCLLLRYSGYSYLEIADTLGVAVGSVGTILARSEEAFRARYVGGPDQ